MPDFNRIVPTNIAGDLPDRTLDRLGEYAADTGNGLGSALAATYATRGEWASQVMSALSRIAPPVNTPTLAYADDHYTSAITSAVGYRPSICGTGSQVTGWDGQDDPNIAFHPGVFNSANGGSADLTLIGTEKPGASSASRWPVIAEFDTSATVSQVEFAVYGTPGLDMRIEVNGQPIIANSTLIAPSGLATGKKLTLTFPDARARRIRAYIPGGLSLYKINVTTGSTISKPTDTERVGAWIGDSYADGAYNVSTTPVAGAGQFDTFALTVLKALGCNRFALCGIGSTGLTTANPYGDRVATVVGLSPDVLCINGSINDGTAAGTIQTALASVLTASSAVDERYVIGTMKSAYEDNHDAVKAAADAASVPFVNMRAFINGTGKVTAPTGDGNADVFVLPDNAHPTYAAHRAIEGRIISEAVRLKESA